MFHWFLVAAVAIALFTGLFGPLNWLNIHLAAGAAIAGLVAFRILWGFLGSTYARFSSFPIGPSAIGADLAGLATGRRPGYVGHNPLGSLMALALLVTLMLIVIAGVLTLGGVDKQGPLAFTTSYAAGRTAQRFHKVLAYGLIGLIASHLAGVAYESVHTRANLVGAMLTSEKAVSAASHTARPARARAILTALMFVLLIGVAQHQIAALSERLALGAPVEALDPIYVEECGSCHMAYPPSLAPASRWTALMAGLSDHFAEDASLKPAVAVQIRAYLVNNSAEKWDTRAAHEFARPSPTDPLRLTATPFWVRMHRRIAESVFKSAAVGAKSACDKCHGDATTGRFDPQNIRIPEQALQ